MIKIKISKLLEDKKTDKKASVRWTKPNAELEKYELFGRGVQLLHEGELVDIIDKNSTGDISKSAEEIYDELSKYSEFLMYAKDQSKAANCLAGEAFQRAYSKGKIIKGNWENIFSASADDINFGAMYKRINREKELKKRIEIANELSNKTTIEGQKRDLTGMVKSMLEGKEFPAPSIYVGNKITFIAGKTRVLSCMALDIVPNIWTVNREDVIKSVKRQND